MYNIKMFKPIEAKGQVCVGCNNPINGISYWSEFNSLYLRKGPYHEGCAVSNIMAENMVLAQSTPSLW